MNEIQNAQYKVHSAKIEQIMQDISEIKTNMREMKRENKVERQEFWQSLNKLRESITGNSKEGLAVRVDRNTQFRRNLSKLLWALFTPLYSGLIIILLKILSDVF